jgi:hypothetical protein
MAISLLPAFKRHLTAENGVCLPLLPDKIGQLTAQKGLLDAGVAI